MKTASRVGWVAKPMDMKHDFPFEPDTRVEAAKPRVWRPELFAIVAIFIGVWVALALHYLEGGSGW